MRQNVGRSTGHAATVGHYGNGGVTSYDGDILDCDWIVDVNVELWLAGVGRVQTATVDHRRHAVHPLILARFVESTPPLNVPGNSGSDESTGETHEGCQDGSDHEGNGTVEQTGFDWGTCIWWTTTSRQSTNAASRPTLCTFATSSVHELQNR